MNINSNDREFFMKVFSIGKTDVGLKRNHNEDSFYNSDDYQIYLVADGMGGHAAGEVASKTAIEYIVDFIVKSKFDSDITWPFGVVKALSKIENKILTGFKLANKVIYELSNDHSDYTGMGTTMVGLFINNNIATVAHVGDSRAYLIRKNEITQLTNDHSWVNEQLRKNIITQEEAKNHKWKNVITRALGNKLEIDVDFYSEPIMPNDIYLLCSDGLSGMLTNEEIKKAVLKNQDDLLRCCDDLIYEANKSGGIDNITTVIVKCVEETEEKEKKEKKKSK